MGAPAASRPMAAGSVSTISFPEQGLHSRLRDKLNRLQRRTKVYSKRVDMLSDSIALVCLSLKLI